jgi:poly(3-hydroxyalkanoate) synthetase
LSDREIVIIRTLPKARNKVTMLVKTDVKKKIPFVGNRNGGRKNRGAIAQGAPIPVSTQSNFVGECDARKECVFNCANGNQLSAFEVQMKKRSIYIGSMYTMVSFDSVMDDNLCNVTAPQITVYTRTGVIHAQIT